MSYPILYSATEADFSHNGLGILGDCASCDVTEEANGIFELAMTYPMDGIHYEDIADRAIIKAKADQFRDPQLFRIYAISKPMSGLVTVLAEHISYDLSGIPVSPFTAYNAPDALSGLKENAVVDCPFDFWTDKSETADFKVSVPASIRSRLGGASDSVLSIYGGEYEFDNYTVKLHNNRGMSRGVSIRYGKNLTDIRQEQNCSNVATGVYPYWANRDGTTLVELPEKILNAPGTYGFVKIKTVDFSKVFKSKPTQEQLRDRAEQYIEEHEIGIPLVSLDVSFAQLSQTEEYKHLKLLERVSLFDTVNVEFPALGVSATAKAVKMVYDVLSDRVKSVALGSVRANIADTIVNQRKEIQEAPTQSDLERAKEAATEWLTNGKGYEYKRRDESGMVIETFYLDTPDIETAVNVLRIGQSGIGFSHNGINGPYESAWTIDGNFVADFITSGTLNAALLKVINLNAESIVAGVMSSIDGTVKIDLTNNKVLVYAKDKSYWFEISAGSIMHYTQDADGNAVRHLLISPGADTTATQIVNENGSVSVAGQTRSNFGNLVCESVVEGGSVVIRAFNEFGGSGDIEISAKGVLKIQGKSVSWKDNGDETYTMIGQ